jgi:hypothetical protein
VGDQVAKPLRVARLPAGRAEHRVRAPHLLVDERVDPFGARLGPVVVQQQHRLPLEEPPAFPPFARNSAMIFALKSSPSAKAGSFREFGGFSTRSLLAG